MGTRTPDAVDKAVGRRVKLRRRLLKLSQSELAAQIGTTFQQVQKYEGGENRLPAGYLYRIARALKVPIAYFFVDMPAHPETSMATVAFDETLVDEMLTRQGIALLRAFTRIRSARLRERILDMVAQAAGEEEI